LKEIANEMGLNINRYVDWIRAERRLSRSLRALTRLGWVAWSGGREKKATSFGTMLIGRLN
jgi:hypothetical protein